MDNTTKKICEMKRISLITLCVAITSALMAQSMPPIRVAMLLPLQTELMKRDKNTDRFVDFYSGALLAVYEHQSRGQEIELYTYDVAKSTHSMSQILTRPELDSMDFIIGPAYANQVALMTQWAYQHNVRVLFPFSSEVPDIANNPYLMQFNPSVESEAMAMAGYLANSGNAVRCIFVQAADADIPHSVRCLQQQLTAHGLECVYTTVHDILSDSLPGVMSDEAENILLMNTERFANLRAVMPHLMRAAQGHRLTLMSRYSWQQETIALPQLYTTVFHTDPEEDDTYEDLYARFYLIGRQSSHPCYDQLGYDQMQYVLLTIEALRENTWTEMDDVLCHPYNGLQSDMRFEPVVENGGYQNKYIQIVRVP